MLPYIGRDVTGTVGCKLTPEGEVNSASNLKLEWLGDSADCNATFVDRLYPGWGAKYICFKWKNISVWTYSSIVKIFRFGGTNFISPDGTPSLIYPEELEVERKESSLIAAYSSLFTVKFKNGITLEMKVVGGSYPNVEAKVSLKYSSKQEGESANSVSNLSMSNQGTLIKADKYSNQRILIKADTDVYLGLNLAQCVMTLYSNNKVQVLNQYLPEIAKYLKDNSIDNCSYTSKVTALKKVNYPNEFTEEVMGRITLYALLRYYLWFLITGCKTLDILYNRYTLLFYRVLSKSKYSEFIEVFTSDESKIKDYNINFKW